MTPSDRAALNRQAAVLAGYTFAAAYGGEQVTTPQGVHWGWLPAGAAGPDFVGDAGLWWGLVEGMARLLAEQGGAWEGPKLREGYWRVELFGPRNDYRALERSEPGVVAVEGALAVAAALGLEAGD